MLTDTQKDIISFLAKLKTVSEEAAIAAGAMVKTKEESLTFLHGLKAAYDRSIPLTDDIVLRAAVTARKMSGRVEKQEACQASDTSKTLD